MFRGKLLAAMIALAFAGPVPASAAPTVPGTQRALPQARRSAEPQATAPAAPKTLPKKKRAALRTIRARAPGAPIRDIDRLAELTRHASVPAGLTSGQRKLLATAVRDYRAGRDRRGASVMGKLVGDVQATGGSQLLPAVFGHLAYHTAVGTNSALDRAARRYAFETRKLAAIEREIKRLRKVQRAGKAAVTLELKRWHVGASATGEPERARSTKQLDAAELTAELDFQTKQRQLAQAHVAWLKAVFDRNSSQETVDEAEALVNDAEQAVQDAIDQAEDAVNEAVQGAEDAANEAIQNAEDAVNEVIANLEAAVETVANEDGEASSDGTDEQTEVERLLALAERLSRECIDEQNAESCAELANVAAQLADALAQESA